MGDFNDLDDLEVEVLDDELFPTPGKGDGETSDGDHAVVVKANPLSSTLPPLKKPQHAPLPPIAGQRAPLGAPLRRVSEPAGSRTHTSTEAPLEKADAAVSMHANARVTGSMMDGGEVSSSSSDDDDAYENQTSDDHQLKSAKETTSIIPTNIPALDAFGDELEVQVEDEEDDDAGNDAGMSSSKNNESPKRNEKSKLSSGDAAIDAIDLLDAQYSSETTASQRGVDKLQEKYVDTFELENDEQVLEQAQKSARSNDDDDDDEFGYAFEGDKREGAVHVTAKPEFKMKPMPKNLVTDVRMMPMETFAEEEEEEEEEEVETATADEDHDNSFAVPEASSDVDEWDAVNLERENEADTTETATTSAPSVPQKPKAKKKRKPPTPLNYQNVRDWFAAEEVDETLRNNLQVTEVDDSVGCCGALFSALFSPKPRPLTYPGLLNERVTFFATAKTAMDDDNETHINLLNKVYTSFLELTDGDSSDTITPPERFGQHWETLGFQGTDPGTDLRGSGVLSLLQLFCLADTDPKNAKLIFELSKHETHEFPMAPLGINVTRVTLKVLRKGLLNAKIKQLNSVWKTCDLFYKGAWFHYFLLWRDGKKTMAQSGFVNKEWEAFVVSEKGVQRAFALAEGWTLPPEKWGVGGDGKKTDDARGNSDDELEFTSF